MKIYTGNGDKGMTQLKNMNLISKSDDRFEALGTVEELSSYLGLIKSLYISEFGEHLERIQRALDRITEEIKDPRNRAYQIEEEEIAYLESEIDRLEISDLDREGNILPGSCEKSARFDVARAVTRRAERVIMGMAKKYGVNMQTEKYLNRLGDYLYACARTSDCETQQGVRRMAGGEKTVVEQVLERINEYCVLPLDRVTAFLQKIESYAKQNGKKAVLAVCNAQGNPIAVHVMDDAFLVSFQVAIQKAYTSVAVKMSTMELSRLVQPGQTFYGLDSLQDGKIVAFGGGVPLRIGGKIVGGLGISGGTGEEDHALCEYALSIFSEFF
ncbi:MAG: cob(I)yrinic acid a,c-diamide adenosyltransferase [Eubacteriales bacterium]|nr:cob(I)yrinic acid a,c-diamide adenosyltransferase [Eubacteriales bacterium]